MGKSNAVPVSSWGKLVWNFVWLPMNLSLSMKETRRPVAFGLIVLICAYFILELYLFFIVDNIPAGVHLPITTNTSDYPCHASPYCVITTKGLFLGVIDFYIQKPLAVIANGALSIDSFVSANFISFTHIVTALISAKLISSDSLFVRRVGVFLYELRNFLDSLDGVVAKEEYKRRGELHLFSQPTGFWGYCIDGVSDGFGCLFLLAACCYFMHRHPYQRKIQQKVYTQLTGVSVSTSPLPKINVLNGSSHKLKKDDKGDSEAQHPVAQNSGCGFINWCRQYFANFRITGAGVPAFLFLNQLLLSSLFWNRNIILYGRILEPTSPGANETGYGTELDYTASAVIHSPYMWVVIFSWRLCNPLFVTELLLLAIFLDKMHEFLHMVMYSGFFVVSAVSVMSEIHRWTAIHIHPAKSN